MTSGAIASRFDCSGPTTTRHLRALEDAGLVRVELKGRERVYKLDRVRLNDVAGGWVERFREETAGDPVGCRKRQGGAWRGVGSSPPEPVTAASIRVVHVVDDSGR
ncbi:MAG: ArsR/SmtB family transcription factor [Acidimicrobiales bacterium]